MIIESQSPKQCMHEKHGFWHKTAVTLSSTLQLRFDFFLTSQLTMWFHLAWSFEEFSVPSFWSVGWPQSQAWFGAKSCMAILTPSGCKEWDMEVTLLLQSTMRLTKCELGIHPAFQMNWDHRSEKTGFQSEHCKDHAQLCFCPCNLANAADFIHFVVVDFHGLDFMQCPKQACNGVFSCGTPSSGIHLWKWRS